MGCRSLLAAVADPAPSGGSRHWHQRRRGGVAAGGPIYQPVWQSAVLAPTDLALAAIGFYLLRVVKLPIPAIAALLVMAAILLA